MSGTITLAGTFTLLHCANCGAPIVLEETFERARRNDHKTFYCPNGHRQYFPGKTDEQKQRERAKRAENRAERAEARAIRLQDECETAERRRRGQKAATTRLQKKLKQGQCPCCAEKFDDLAEHMTERHPDYAETQEKPS